MGIFFVVTGTCILCYMKIDILDTTKTAGRWRSTLGNAWRLVLHGKNSKNIMTGGGKRKGGKQQGEGLGCRKYTKLSKTTVENEG